MAIGGHVAFAICTFLTLLPVACSKSSSGGFFNPNPPQASQASGSAQTTATQTTVASPTASTSPVSSSATPARGVTATAVARTPTIAATSTGGSSTLASPSPATSGPPPPPPPPAPTAACTPAGPPQIISTTEPVMYSSGWRLASGPAGTVLTANQGYIYTLQPGGSSYQVVPPGSALQAGVAYWAYFRQPTRVTLQTAEPQYLTRTLPAGQWVFVGNPGLTTAQVTGPDCLYALNASGNYAPVSGLEPGQGGMAFSIKGGTATIANWQLTTPRASGR
jgi:hypothetical protein